MSAALVVQLIAQVGWPAAQYLIERHRSKDQEWTPADDARLAALIRTPIAAYEAAVVPLPGKA